MIQYRGCGLDGIYLADGYVEYDGPDGTAIAIKDIDGLHRAIADDLVRSSAAMTGKVFKFLRKEMCFSQKRMACFLGVEEQTVSLWERGSDVPQHAEVIIKGLVREKISGNAELLKLLDEINQIDRTGAAINKQYELSVDGWHEKLAA